MPRRDTVSEVFTRIDDTLPPIATSSFYHHVCGSGENSQLPSLLQERKRKMKKLNRIHMLLRIDEGSLDSYVQKQWLFLQNNLEEFW